MVKGFSAFFLGLIVGILAWTVGLLIVYRVVIIKPDWALTVSIPIFGALLGWSFAFISLVRKEIMKELEDKATHAEVEIQVNSALEIIKVHKESDNQRYEMLKKTIDDNNSDLKKQVSQINTTVEKIFFAISGIDKDNTIIKPKKK